MERRKNSDCNEENVEKLSAIIVALNEEINIETCLKSLQWVDEIIVVIDDRTTDRTEEIARFYTSHVFVQEWQGYSGSKNFALSKATGDWIFWIDADEEVTPNLQTEIQKAIRQGKKYAGYEIPRLAFFLGRWIRHSGWYPGYVLRLFQRSKAQFNQALVHEGVQLTGEVGRLKNPLLHFTDRDIANYYRKYDSFTSLAARQMAERDRKFRIVDLLFRPLFLFIKMFILRAGFLDGLQGLILAVFSANYVFTKYAKLWERQRIMAEKAGQFRK